MSVPEHLWRFPTKEAIASLASRFDVPNSAGMQDWEWEVADSIRIDEFLSAYETGPLTEDERFTLMETIIQSFEDLGSDLKRGSAMAQGGLRARSQHRIAHSFGLVLIGSWD